MPAVNGLFLTPADCKRGSDAVTGPFRGLLDVTAQASDDVDLTDGGGTPVALVARGLWITGAGNITVRFLDGSTKTFTGVAADTIIPFAANGGWIPGFIVGIDETGLTATGVLAVL